MSQKLDELRKRLLQQQQSENDGEAPEPPPPRVGTGRIFGAKTIEAAVTPQSFEPPAGITAPEPPIAAKAQEPPVEKAPMPEPPVVNAAPKSPAADTSAPAERVNPFGSHAEPETPRFSLGATATAASEAAGQHELADAVGKVFEQTNAFQARLEDLNRIFEPIERMGNSAARAFGPLHGFQKQMAQLAHSFEPMRTFQQQLGKLAQTFEPMKALEDQLAQLANSFQSHLGDLIKALEPAKQMRDRIEQLGAAFDQATELQEQFSELYDAFQLSPAPNEAHANGLDSQRETAG
jgi:ABC-type transporter Mla subunit MlaD